MCARRFFPFSLDFFFFVFIVRYFIGTISSTIYPACIRTVLQLKLIFFECRCLGVHVICASFSVFKYSLDEHAKDVNAPKAITRFFMNENGLIKIELENISYCFLFDFLSVYFVLGQHIFQYLA